MPNIIFIADNHANPTSTNAVAHLIPHLLKHGFDTVCIESGLIPGRYSQAEIKKIHMIDVEIKQAIEANNTQNVIRKYGHELVEAEMSIATSSHTHKARADLVDVIFANGLKHFPIDVEFPTKETFAKRNVHMEKRIREALAQSKTKNIIVFGGYAHMTNQFQNNVYLRGLVSSVCKDDIIGSVYFPYAVHDEAYNIVVKLQTAHPILSAKYSRMTEIVGDNFDELSKQVIQDLTTTPSVTVQKALFSIVMMKTSSPTHPLYHINRDTLLYLNDLKVSDLKNHIDNSIPGYIIWTFQCQIDLMTDNALEILNLKKVFISGDISQQQREAIKFCFVPMICHIQDAEKDNVKGIFIIFPGNSDPNYAENTRLQIEAKILGRTSADDKPKNTKK